MRLFKTIDHYYYYYFYSMNSILNFQQLLTKFKLLIKKIVTYLNFVHFYF